MKLIFALIFLMYALNCSAQDVLNIYTTKHNINAKLDTISEIEFYKNGKPVSGVEPNINPKIDSILNVLWLRYPASISDSAGYLSLRGGDQTKYLWKDTVAADPTRWITYMKLDYKNGFLIFYNSYPTGEEYILFNPQNKTLRILKGFPVFADSKTVYDIGNYLGEYFFQYKSLTKDSYLQILSNSWSITQHYYAYGKFYIEFDGGERKKFLRISFPKN